ncbi:MAG: ice-binding family protein [Candidatus Saccharimonas sp.]
MKLIKSVGILTALVVMLAISPMASAATSPGLGAANSFVILSSTYSNTASGTTLNGDLGYTTPPAVAPTVNGATHQADSVYNQAGIHQNNALIALNNQPCSFTFAPGPIDLASDTTHGPVGVYTPGVYCISGAASVGGGGTITLNGIGTYIFRMDGALTTSANSVVVLAGGASVCDVWWTPIQSTTIGANSTFEGTDLDAAGITIGSTVNWTGQALAFGGTVSTQTDTISAPTCSAARSLPPPIPASVPGLPNTAEGTSSSNTLWIIVPVLGVAFAALYMARRKI